MKIEYTEPTVVDRIEEAIAQAKKENKQIDCIRLSAPELAEFCEIGGQAFSKGCRYTYKDYSVAYDLDPVDEL